MSDSVLRPAFEKMKVKSYQKGYRQGYSKAIDDFYILFISEVKNRYPDIPIASFEFQRIIWKAENEKYLECEKIALEIAEQLKKDGADAGSI